MAKSRKVSVVAGEPEIDQPDLAAVGRSGHAFVRRVWPGSRGLGKNRTGGAVVGGGPERG